MTDRALCDICRDPAEVRFSWPTSQGPQTPKLCGCCAAQVWNTLSSKFTGTEAYLSFQCEPVA